MNRVAVFSMEPELLKRFLRSEKSAFVRKYVNALICCSIVIFSLLEGLGLKYCLIRPSYFFLEAVSMQWRLKSKGISIEFLTGYGLSFLNFSGYSLARST